MSEIMLTSLALVLTERCNLSCKHCMRGNSVVKKIDEKTIDNVFKQISFIDTLSLCGGEPLIEYELLKYLVEYIIENKVILLRYTLITNGTLYTEKMSNLFDKLEQYVSKVTEKFTDKKQICGLIDISMDKFHREELERIKSVNPNLYNEYIDNIKRLMKSPYFESFMDLNGIFDVGRAKELDVKKIDIRPMKQLYYLHDEFLHHGPLLTILTDGTVSECDGEFDYLRKYHNYGNINTDNLEEIILNNSKKCKIRKAFEWQIDHELRKYQRYT